MESAAFTSTFTGANLTARPSLSTPVTSRRAPKRSDAVKAVLGTRTSAPNFGATKAPRKFKVTVMQKDRCTLIEVEEDANLRKALLDAKVDVYTLGGKLRNCGGGGSCGTCVVDVEEGLYMTNGRTMKEERRFEGKPDSWRLACRTTVHGDITVRTKPQA